jgi:arginase
MLSTNKVTLLSVPFDLGAGRQGALLGPEAILQAGLIRHLSKLDIDVENQGKVAGTVAPVSEQNSKLHHLNEIVAMNTQLAKRVASIVQSGSSPLVLGGDHSIAIGTIAGLSAHYRDLGIIWFDAHADLNTEDTTPSGNVHGMSLSVALGRGPSILTQIRGAAPLVKPENVVIIGARQVDPGEREYIKSTGITCFTMHEIDRLGMANIMDRTLDKLGKHTDGVHLSFDMDSLDPREAPGTGTPVNGGVSYREAHFALELMHESKLITSAEFVELNPQLDFENRTARLAVELICSLLGQTIL